MSRHVFRSAYYVLGTTSLLHALGLNASGLPVSAALQWVLKDGLGMGAKLAVSTRLASSFDAEAKRWRMTGDTLMAVGAAVEISTLLKPSYFLLFASAAALLKETAGAVSGPPYRVFLDSFAISANIGDVSSRGEAQVVFGNLVGLGFGVAVASLLGKLSDNAIFAPTFAAYSVLAVCHLGSTYKAVRSVQMRTLNWHRLNLILDTFLDTYHVPSVRDTNTAESFLYFRSRGYWRLCIGARPLDYIENMRDVTELVENSDDRFLVAYSNGRAGVMLRDDVRPEDLLRATLHGRRLLHVVDEMGGCDEWSAERLRPLLDKAYAWAEEAFPKLVIGLKEQGWSTSTVLISTGAERYREYKY